MFLPPGVMVGYCTFGLTERSKPFKPVGGAPALVDGQKQGGAKRKGAPERPPPTKPMSAEA